jgi:hypothetical protein
VIVGRQDVCGPTTKIGCALGLRFGAQADRHVALDLNAATGSFGAKRGSKNPFSKHMSVYRSALMPYLMLSLLLILGSLAGVCLAQENSGASIQQMMTPEEFKAAGLDKLSSEELQKLDAWLQGYRQTTEKKASEVAEKKASSTARTKLDMLVSRVDGSFEGLKGRTVIKLEDGTAWRQANAEDRFRPTVTDHPGAVVSHTVFGYKMRIEGTPEFYVDPIRNP